MVVVEGQGIPIGVHLDSAQRAEITLAQPTLASIRVPRERGRPRTRPGELVADKGYDSQEFRQSLRRRGIHPCIPERPGRKPRRGRKPNLVGYRQRWKVERTFAWMGNFRRLLVRQERILGNYRSFFLIACTLICLRWVSE